MNEPLFTPEKFGLRNDHAGAQAICEILKLVDKHGPTKHQLAFVVFTVLERMTGPRSRKTGNLWIKQQVATYFPETNMKRTACELCAHRKTKCQVTNGNDSCDECVKRGITCVAASASKRKREAAVDRNGPATKALKLETNMDTVGEEHDVPDLIFDSSPGRDIPGEPATPSTPSPTSRPKYQVPAGEDDLINSAALITPPSATSAPGSRFSDASIPINWNGPVVYDPDLNAGGLVGRELVDEDLIGRELVDGDLISGELVGDFSNAGNAGSLMLNDPMALDGLAAYDPNFDFNLNAENFDAGRITAGIEAPLPAQPMTFDELVAYDPAFDANLDAALAPPLMQDKPMTWDEMIAYYAGFHAGLDALMPNNFGPALDAGFGAPVVLDNIDPALNAGLGAPLMLDGIDPALSVGNDSNQVDLSAGNAGNAGNAEDGDSPESMLIAQANAANMADTEDGTDAADVSHAEEASATGHDLGAANDSTATVAIATVSPFDAAVTEMYAGIANLHAAGIDLTAGDDLNVAIKFNAGIADLNAITAQLNAQIGKWSARGDVDAAASGNDLNALLSLGDIFDLDAAAASESGAGLADPLDQTLAGPANVTEDLEFGPDLFTFSNGESESEGEGEEAAPAQADGNDEMDWIGGYQLGDEVENQMAFVDLEEIDL
ncbi:hypothetical protein B7463_g12426 [Lecanosticta acicola]|uniref:Zn(2)-C6 fungal-type domain-containing protein n=1 Tax=Lecanosticta acicola TaxID=111012 RepID=A0AAI8Z5P4_9PEZI|nr:hypothetical protein B7463_g12426 [Lecanosticta acicola]